MMTPPVFPCGAPSPVAPAAIREVVRTFSTSSGWTLGRSMSTVTPVQPTRPDPGLRPLAAIELGDSRVIPSPTTASPSSRPKDRMG